MPARPQPCVGKATNGELDVACALRVLNHGKQPSWDMIPITPQADLEGYRDFIRATSSCHEKRALVEEQQLTVKTNDAFALANRFATTGRPIASEHLGAAPDSNSLAWQLRTIPIGSTWNAGRAAFQMAEARRIANGAARTACVQGRAIDRRVHRPRVPDHVVEFGFGNVVKPRGWWFPTTPKRRRSASSSRSGWPSQVFAVPRAFDPSPCPCSLRILPRAGLTYGPPGALVLLALGIGALDASVASAAIGDEALGVSVDLSPAVQNGGDGTVVVRPAEVTASAVPVSDLRLTIAASRVARLRVASAGPWLCSRAVGRRIDCRLSGSTAPPRRWRSASTWARGAGSLWDRGAAATQAPPCQAHAGPAGVRALRPLLVTAEAVDARVSDALPGQGVRPVTLQGSVGRRTAEPIRYAWRQLCPRQEACTRVRWLSTRADVLTEGEPVASFAVPHVARAQSLRFELSASDGRGRAAATTVVRVQPQVLARLDPRLGSTRLTAQRFQGSSAPGTRVALALVDRAAVRITGAGATRVSAGALVRLQIVVHGQRARSVRWSMLIGPGAVLTDAQRRGATIAFRAPATPGTYMLRRSCSQRPDGSSATRR